MGAASVGEGDVVGQEGGRRLWVACCCGGCFFFWCVWLERKLPLRVPKIEARSLGLGKETDRYRKKIDTQKCKQETGRHWGPAFGPDPRAVVGSRSLVVFVWCVCSRSGGVVFLLRCNERKERWVNAQAHLSTTTKNYAVCSPPEE